MGMGTLSKTVGAPDRPLACRFDGAIFPRFRPPQAPHSFVLPYPPFPLFPRFRSQAPRPTALAGCRTIWRRSVGSRLLPKPVAETA